MGDGAGPPRFSASRPVVLGFALVLLTVVASRDLLGAGRLMGGALLPAPDSAGDLWRTYTEGWHPVGVGSETASPPSLAVLAALGTVLLGNASAAVSLVLLGAVPLAGLTAYLALRRVVASPCAADLGRNDLCLAARGDRSGRGGPDRHGRPRGPAAARCGGRPARGPRAWLRKHARRLDRRRAARGDVGLRAARLSRRPRPRAWLRWPRAGWAGSALMRLLVCSSCLRCCCCPGCPQLVRHPQLLLLEGGLVRPELVDPSLHPLAVFLLHPGGPGMYPLAFSVGLVLAALAALLRPDRRRLVAAGWATALAGIAGGIALSHIRLDAPGLAGSRGRVARAGDADGRRRTRARCGGGGRGRPRADRPEQLRLACRSRRGGHRRRARRTGPGRAVVGVPGRGRPAASGATPCSCRRSSPPRESTATVPARWSCASSRRAGCPMPCSAPTGRGSATPTPSRASDIATGLDETVADLASGRGGDAATDLLPYGVRFVLLGRPVDPALADAIDAVPGLVRVSAPDRSALWKVRYPSGRVAAIVSGSRTDTSGTVLPSGAVGVRTDVPAASAPRLLTIADQRDDRWQATLDGQRLEPQQYDGWAQAFALPADGGRLVVRYDDGNRQLLLWLQLAAVIVALVLALPSVRAVDESDEHAVAEPPPPAPPARWTRATRWRRRDEANRAHQVLPRRHRRCWSSGPASPPLVGPPSAVVAQAPGPRTGAGRPGGGGVPGAVPGRGRADPGGHGRPGAGRRTPARSGEAQLLRLSRTGRAGRVAGPARPAGRGGGARTQPRRWSAKRPTTWHRGSRRWRPPGRRVATCAACPGRPASPPAPTSGSSAAVPRSGSAAGSTSPTPSPLPPRWT